MKKLTLLITIATVFFVGCVTTSKANLRPGMVAKKYNVIAVATDSNDGFHMSEAKKFTSSFSSIGTII